MKKRNLSRSALMAGCVLLLIVAVLGGLTWYIARQEKINQALKVAIEQTNVGDVQNLLKQGADPNTLYRPQPGSIWQTLWRRMQHTGAQAAAENAPNPIQYTLQTYMNPGLFASRPENAEPSFRIIRLLIEAGASAKVTAPMSASEKEKTSNLLSFSIVYLNISSFKEDMLRFLLQQGVDVDGKEGTGESPLYEAACIQDGDEGSVKILLDAGADVNHVSSEGTALEAASYYSSPEVVGWLLDRGAHVNTAPVPGERRYRTALMEVCERMNTAKAALLLAHGANINAQDNEGNTALMHVCNISEPKEERSIFVRFLLAYHPRLNIKNHDGQTALAILIEADSSVFPDHTGIGAELVRVLRQAGATR